MSEQCQSGECNRKAFEMPSGCPPVEKPPIIDVQACELPPLVPTEFERHPLVVDLPSIPINVGCACIDVETHMTVSSDRHTANSLRFGQAAGSPDCCVGLYALDLQLNIPTCSTDPPNITGHGSRGITVSGKGIPRADEPCMFDLDMDITVPCPLEGVSIGDGKGIAKIEKGPPPSFSNCNLSFDVNVPCPLPGITFVVTGQASGSIVTGGQKSIASDGNHSTVDSGGDGGGRVGGNTVLSVGRARILSPRGASGATGSSGASGASGGGGGGGSGDPCTLELRLNVPCQLPGVTFTVTGLASGGIKKPSGVSATGGDCKTELEVHVPCQLPNIRVLDTRKPSGSHVKTPKIQLKDAIKLLKPSGPTGCEAMLQLEADDISIPCSKLSFDVTGPATGTVTDDSNDCSKVVSLTVDCQLDALTYGSSASDSEWGDSKAVDGNTVNPYGFIRLINNGTDSQACSKKIVVRNFQIPKKDVYLPDSLKFEVTGSGSSKKLQITITKKKYTVFTSENSGFGDSSPFVASVPVSECN